MEIFLTTGHSVTGYLIWSQVARSFYVDVWLGVGQVSERKRGNHFTRHKLYVLVGWFMLFCFSTFVLSASIDYLQSLNKKKKKRGKTSFSYQLDQRQVWNTKGMSSWFTELCRPSFTVKALGTIWLSSHQSSCAPLRLVGRHLSNRNFTPTGKYFLKLTYCLTVIYKHNGAIVWPYVVIKFNPALAYSAFLQCLPSFPGLWTSRAWSQLCPGPADGSRVRWQELHSRKSGSLKKTIRYMYTTVQWTNQVVVCSIVADVGVWQERRLVDDGKPLGKQGQSI